MKIGVYGGSLRPGGGITALRQVLDALLAMEGVEITLFTGTDDCSAAVQDLFQDHPQLAEERFHPQASAFARYLRSKLAFLRRGREFDWIFSVNYYIPAPCRVAVYHLNLLSFQRGPGDGFAAALKRLDARSACRRADLNLFESEFLLNTARTRTNERIQSPELLYLGVHPAFFADPDEQVEAHSDQLLMVSSTAPHKDNATAIQTLAQLVAQRPEVNWRLKIAGGQSVAQWSGLLDIAKKLGVEQRVEILGPLPRAELSKVMRSSLCLINPSRIESFCMVALEAMASYCPTIVTAESSMPESVGDAAQIVEAGAAQAFAAAVIRNYDQPDFRKAQLANGRARAESFGHQRFRLRLREALSR